MLKKWKRDTQTKTGGTIRQLSDGDLFGLLTGEQRLIEAAFSELFDRHSRRVYTYALWMLGDKDLSEDIVQDTFIRFLDSGRKKREVLNIEAYLVTIARNLCLNAIRKRRDTVTFDEFRFPQFDTGHEKAEMLQLIHTAMELLPEDQRESYILREIEDLRYDEIASMLQVTEVTVRVRVTRARQGIRKILKPYLLELSK